MGGTQPAGAGSEIVGGTLLPRASARGKLGTACWAKRGRSVRHRGPSVGASAASGLIKRGCAFGRIPDLDHSPQVLAALLLGVSLLGALPPLFRRWSDRGLHLFVAVSAGIFLGTTFLHLLPELAGVSHADHGHAHEGEAGLGPWIAALSGLLLLFFLERVWLRGFSERPGGNVHSSLWVATYVGLAIHALTAGVALTAILHSGDGQTPFLVSYLVHKASETFSLATVMRLAQMPLRRAMLLLLGFALIEPTALLLGNSYSVAHPEFELLLTGFACGTFLYVAVCDLLPEVFHGRSHPRLKILAVVLGVLTPALSMEQLAGIGSSLGSLGAAVWDVLLQMAPYLLAGFLLAGVLHRWLRIERWVHLLGGKGLGSVLRAAGIGAPLPLCSCSVVPVAIELKRKGASRGATTAFLIATPETGVDSVSVSWSLLDPLLTIARPIAALISAVLAGLAVNRWGRDPLPATPDSATAAHSCCTHQHPAEPSADTAAAAPKAAPAPVGILRYAFVDMLDDLAPSLVVGLLLSALVTLAVPESVFLTAGQSSLGSMLLMLLVGIPMYICAAASTPVAAAMILKGLSPGAALVFLLAGPATNIGSLAILARELGWRTIGIMLLTLSLTAIALGLLVDQCYRALGLEARASVAEHSHSSPGWFAQICALSLVALVLFSLVRTRLRPWLASGSAASAEAM